MGPSDELTIGQVAQRAGVATSALRFYERQGLIRALRTQGNQRRYPRSVLRLVAVIKAAQAVGLSLDEIRQALAELPEGRVPNKADWSRLSRQWRSQLEARIRRMERLRDAMDACIGCGCLSLRACGLFNPDDADGLLGPGARRL